MNQVPPSDPNAELAYLANAIALPGYLDEHPIRPDDFYDRTNSRILESIIAIHERGVGLDVVAVMSELRANGHPEAGAKLSEVLDVPVQTVGDFERHIQECARRRRVIDLARVLTAEAHDRTEPIDRLVSCACADLESTGADTDQAGQLASLRDMLRDSHARVSERAASGVSGDVAISTGHWRLDRDTGGYRPGKVAIVGAQSHWGKSSYALLVADLALLKGKRVLIVTAEDDEGTWADRWLQYRAKVPRGRFESGIVNGDHQNAMVSAVADAPDSPVLLNAIGRTIEWSVSQVRSIVRKDPGEWLVMYDYLGAWAEGARDNAEQMMKINHIARTATTCIKTLGTAGILFSQITPTEKMGMYSLRHSKDIANAAEVILLGALNGEAGRTMLLAKNKPGPGRAGTTYEMGSNHKLQSFEPVTNAGDWEWGEIDGYPG